MIPPGVISRKVSQGISLEVFFLVNYHEAFSDIRQLLQSLLLGDSPQVTPKISPIISPGFLSEVTPEICQERRVL